MSEGERCDRISLMHAAKLLAVGRAKALSDLCGKDCVRRLPRRRGPKRVGSEVERYRSASRSDPVDIARASVPSRCDLRRLWAYARQETMEILAIRSGLRFHFSAL